MCWDNTQHNTRCFICVPRQGIHGMLPLHLAVLYGFSDCCRKLLSSGEHLFDVSSCVTKHYPPLWHVQFNVLNTDATLKVSTDYLSKVLFLFAHHVGQLYNMVPSLTSSSSLPAGFDINTPDNLGRTCLHAAASGGWMNTHTHLYAYIRVKDLYLSCILPPSVNM